MSDKFHILIKSRPESKVDKSGVDRNKLHKMEEYLEELRERSRRMVVRRLMKGIFSLS